MRQLFGTDGIRAVAGEYPLDRRTVFAIGRALGKRLRNSVAEPRVIIGQDTRESSVWIAETLARGLHVSGAKFSSAGVITTPGVAYLTRTHGFDAGIVISASHNPWMDNGIKLFGSDGMKLADAIEHAIEKDIFAHLKKLAEDPEHISLSAEIMPGEQKLRDDYVNWLASQVELKGLRREAILADCANGAASSVAPALFQKLGIECEFVHVSPDGRNINDKCGALHPHYVGESIRESQGKFHLGVTYDGDADRALFCDHNGRVVNGDAVLLLAARDMKSRNVLRGNKVVATTMSNMGLEKALRESGIEMLRANVGDKYVLEQMQAHGATLGGEQSGHILFMDGDATTGDGLLTSLRVLDVMARTGKHLEELVADLKMFPQVIHNVRVREKLPMAQMPSVKLTIETAEKELDGNGRVVVRYSGTEKLARVMIEAESETLMKKHADAIAGALHAAIGV